MLRVPQSYSQLDTRERHKKPPAEAGGHGSREPAASCRSSLGGPPPAHSRPGPPGLAPPQKAPGGSRGTPGRMPSQVPCEVGLNREIECRHPAWTAGWLSCPESPGFHPGLLVFVPGPEGRVDSKRAQARQANRGTRPRVCVQHAPGFPPGASWAAEETESQFKGSAKQRSQADSCSGVRRCALPLGPKRSTAGCRDGLPVP